MSKKKTGGVLHFAGAVYRSFASLKLAVVLIVLLAAVLAWATFMEADRGREYTQWYVYDSPWFIALLALLGVNILAAALTRFPWRWRQLGFVVTHAGLLVLLVGSIQTFIGGIEGQFFVVEGEQSDSILLGDRSQLKVVTQGPTGTRSTDFSFSPGPVDWPADESLDFGQADDLGVKVLKFYRRARREVSWVADETGQGAPAIELRVADSRGHLQKEFWCVAKPFSNRTAAGTPTFQLQQAPVASMLDDFLQPTAGEPGTKGNLSVHYQGKRHTIAIDENLGKRVPVGDGAVEIEIVAYYANAVFEGMGRFRSKGTLPKNPMLDLKIYLPDRQEPISEIAYAKNPLVSFASMRGQPCPVKFWYHHPGVPAPPGGEFLQTPDEKLYCRVAVDGAYESRGEVRQGDQIAISRGLHVSLVGYLPHARQKVTFYPVQLAPGEDSGPEAAVLVEVTTGGATQKTWLKRNDQQHGAVMLQTPQGPLQLSFGYERLPLGFALKLIDFERGVNPGGMGNASFASEVRLIDKTQNIDEERRISMNEPLVHGKFTFYQSSYQNLADGREASVLSAAYDPGRFLKYLGSLMICVGIFLMFYLKAPFRRRTRTSAKTTSASRSTSKAAEPALADRSRSV